MLIRDRWLLLALGIVLFVPPCLSNVAPLFEVATIAQSLATPCGVVIDSSGSLIISACTACCIYKIGPAGANTVVAGVLGACGTADGAGTAARFAYLNLQKKTRSTNTYFSPCNCVNRTSAAYNVFCTLFSSLIRSL